MNIIDIKVDSMAEQIGLVHTSVPHRVTTEYTTQFL